MDFRTWAEAAHIIWQHDKPRYVAVDTETTGVTFYDTPFCATISWVQEDGTVTSHYFEFGKDEGIEASLAQILVDTPELVMHNAKFDLQKLHLAGILDTDTLDPECVHDTEALAHLLDEHRPKKLKYLARELLGEETDEEDVIRAARRQNKLKKEDGYDRLPREIIVPYALRDTEFTIRLFNLLYPQLAIHDDLLGLYRMEQKLTFTLLRMERAGMAVDLEYVESTAKQYNTKALAQELLIRDITGDEEFNPNSPKQVTAAFERLGIEVASTDKHTLKTLGHPLATALLELRTTRKMHGTYLKPMLQEQRDGILHPWFRQHGTRTGRMSSGGVESS